ncbi:hypothetical protein PENANT_c008G09925 [Penicillium antarcticum]|uniref:Uncharacterized protein n=1 Tax=Penicillium antarcticum TaxID=416450 RepID=A0A1V6QAR2_9EURO|nr:hypothetical protein PENANT_c008G09925 [Penicillium antarcticum]
MEPTQGWNISATPRTCDRCFSLIPAPDAGGWASHVQPTDQFGPGEDLGAERERPHRRLQPVGIHQRQIRRWLLYNNRLNLPPTTI